MSLLEEVTFLMNSVHSTCHFECVLCSKLLTHYSTIPVQSGHWAHYLNRLYSPLFGAKANIQYSPNYYVLLVIPTMQIACFSVITTGATFSVNHSSLLVSVYN